MIFMYDYNICTEADERLFHLQCKALEKHIPGLVKGDFLIDVDGSMTQIYYFNSKEISVHNSYYIGALYIVSEIELSQFFK